MTTKKLKRVALHHIPVIIAITLYIILPFKCPIQYFFHIPCPTCGMSRSLAALLKLNFAKSFELNPMTIPFSLLLLFGLHKDLFPIKKRTATIILICGSVFVFIIYLVRIFF